MPPFYEIKFLSQQSWLVQFENRIALDVHAQVMSLVHALNTTPAPAQTAVAPGISSVAIYFDRAKIPAETVKDHLAEILSSLQIINLQPGKLVEIPVVYNGPDLESVARYCNMNVNEVIQLHSEKVYQVFMIGFQPGFPYLGIVDEKIRVPRLPQPRTSVPAGSVALAGWQTGIYPSTSPGGWQLIGQTSVSLFNNNQEPVSLLQAGDQVRFIPQ
jgi:inhibitor of KinA